MADETLFTTRRDFVAGSLTLLSGAATIPVFLGNTAQALAGPQPVQRKKNDADPILVVVQLAGGNDGLNTIVPYEMDAYYKARRRIAIPKKDVLKLEDGLGLNPAATGLKELWDDGRMAVVQGVGYPNHNRSHFTSMDIWHTADPTLRTQSGWVGRYFDACCAGQDAGPEPIQGIALMSEAPLAMQGEQFFPLAFNNPGSLVWRNGQRDPRAAEVFRKLNNIDDQTSANAGGAGDNLAQFMQRAALKAQVGADEIRSASGDMRASRGRRGGGGGRLTQQLRLVSRMIAADMPTRIYYVSLGGFDTHTNQTGRHRQLMSELGSGIKWFLDELKRQKLDQRVLVMSFSEFGRRVQENASGGTDYGEAAPMFLFGGRVAPGVYQTHPSLSKLHRGDLAYGCDFRRVYATVLQHWLKIKPELVLGKRFSPLRLIKAG